MGPARFLDSLETSWGLSSLAPSEALFLGREAARAFVSILFCGLVFPFLLCLRLHTFKRPNR